MKHHNHPYQLVPELLGMGHVSQILQISPATLRTYELEGLITPEYKKGQKGYSHEQIAWIACIRRMIQDKGISIPALTRLLRLAPCWEIADCPTETQKTCKARELTARYLDRSVHWTNTTPERQRIRESFNKHALSSQMIH